MDRLSEDYSRIDGWIAHYREAHSEDERADLDILLDSSVYNADSPYWPAQEGE